MAPSRSAVGRAETRPAARNAGPRPAASPLPRSLLPRDLASRSPQPARRSATARVAAAARNGQPACGSTSAGPRLLPQARRDPSRPASGRRLVAARASEGGLDEALDLLQTLVAPDGATKVERLGGGVPPPPPLPPSPAPASSSQAVSAGLLQAISELPYTRSAEDLETRASSVAVWRRHLARGSLPPPQDAPWPPEPLRGPLVRRLASLQLPRYCSRHPTVLSALLHHIVQMAEDVEIAMVEAEAVADAEEGADGDEDGDDAGDADADDIAGDTDEERAPQGKDDDVDPFEPEEAEGGGEEDEPPGDECEDHCTVQAQQRSSDGGDDRKNRREGDPQESDGTLSSADGAPPSAPPMTAPPASPPTSAPPPDRRAQAAAARAAADALERFGDEWAPALEALDAAEALDPSASADRALFANEDSGAPEFDPTEERWRRSGWRELRSACDALTRAKPLRDLVAELGRGAELGPRRRARAFADQRSSRRPGVVRDPSVPSETSDLARGAEAARAAPSELALRAPGSPNVAKKLFRARLAERSLLGYELRGWRPRAPARALRSEIRRPAGDRGPLLLCLDTSGSMQGDREALSKACAIAVVRLAARTNRDAMLYAFGDRNELAEIALTPAAKALPQLLSFLERSFGGGTDVDAPLKACMERLERDHWKDVRADGAEAYRLSRRRTSTRNACASSPRSASLFVPSPSRDARRLRAPAYAAFISSPTFRILSRRLTSSCSRMERSRLPRNARSLGCRRSPRRWGWRRTASSWERARPPPRSRPSAPTSTRSETVDSLGSCTRRRDRAIAPSSARTGSERNSAKRSGQVRALAAACVPRYRGRLGLRR